MPIFRRLIGIFVTAFFWATMTSVAVACETNEIDVLGDGTQCETAHFTITTTSTTDVFRFGLGAKGTFYIDWGDGTITTKTSTTTNNTLVEHEYDAADSYVIRMGGAATEYSKNCARGAVFFYGLNIVSGKNGTPENIAVIDGSIGAIFKTLGTGDTQKSCFYDTFKDAVNITTIPAGLFSGVSGNAPNMFRGTFYGCSGLAEIPDDLFDGVSGDTNGISGAATDMFRATFQNCTSLTEIPTDLFTNVSGAANNMFMSTFGGCTRLTKIPTGLFNTISGGANNLFQQTFINCTGVTEIPMGLFNGISKAKPNMFQGTFAGCSKITEIPTDLFAKVSGAAVAMFQNTFGGCTSLTEIPTDLFAKVSGAANDMFRATFQNCTSLTEIPTDLFTNVSGAANSMFQGTFSNCTSLTEIPTGLFAKVSGAANNMFMSTFSGCTSLTEIPANLFPRVSGAAPSMFQYTFQKCSKIIEIPTGLFTKVSGGADSMFYGTFQNCTSLTEIPTGLFSTVSDGADNMFYATFQNCTSLTEIPSGLFGAIPGKSNLFTSTFRDCSRLTTIPEDLFAGFTSGANLMFAGTFQSCTSLTEIPTGLFADITNGAERMFENTFRDCTSLASIPADLFAKIATAAPKLFYATFSGCTSLAGFIPPTTFARLIFNHSPKATDMWLETFKDTQLVKLCPTPYEQYPTGYDTDWDGVVSCDSCENLAPEHSVYTGLSDVGVCLWECAGGYHLDNGVCVDGCSETEYYDDAIGLCRTCPEEYNYNDAIGKTDISQCKISCPAGTYVKMAGYRQLEYLETDNTDNNAQYIDTKYTHNSKNVRGEIGVGVTTSPTKNVNFMGNQSDTNSGYSIGYNNGFKMWNKIDGRLQGATNQALESGVVYDVSFTLTEGDRTLTYGGRTYSGKITDNVTTYDGAGSIHLFDNGVGESNQNWPGRIYYARIYEDDEMVLDIVPVRRLSDGALGMFDKKTDQFFGNIGTGNFIAGPDMHPSSCVDVGLGYYAAATIVNYGGTSPRYACPIGTYSDITTASLLSDCKPCVEATYNDHTGAGVCSTCPYLYDDNSTAGKTSITQCQVACDPGTYVAGAIPTDYTALEYIANTSKSYISFDYTPKSTTLSGEFKIGVTNAISGRADMAGIFSSSGATYLGYQNGGFFNMTSATVSSAQSLTVGNEYTVHFESGKNFQIAVDDSTPVSGTNGRDFTVGGSYKVYVFYGNTGGNHFVGSVYYFKLYDDGELVAELYPVRRNSDGALGMYDVVNQTFYPNSGSAEAFSAGPVGSTRNPCTNVGAGYWASGSALVNYGSVGVRNACPVGLTTVGYGHGADESADCGRLLQIGDNVIYSRSVRQTTPSLGFKTETGDVFWVSASPSNHTLSNLHLTNGTQQYTAYDDSLFYNERSVTSE